MRKKRIISFVLIIALLTVLIPVGVIGTTAYADTVKLSPYQSPYATARATDIAQIRKVSQLSKAQSGEDVAKKINDILFNATYRPSDIGGRDWVKDNRGITGIKSVYDDGLGTLVNWDWESWGCFSYARYVSQYVRGSRGSVVSTSYNSIPTVSEIKTFFKTYANPGEHVRFFYKSSSGYESVHSVAYLACDDDGFYFLSESGNGLKIGVLYCTYSYFRSALRMENGKYTLMIYNTGSAASGGKSASSRSVSVSYAAQSFVPDPKPVPRYTPDTSPYKVPYGRTLLYREWYTVMSGNDVKYIQACLYYLGYNVEIDGRYAGGTAYSSTAL